MIDRTALRIVRVVAMVVVMARCDNRMCGGAVIHHTRFEEKDSAAAFASEAFGGFIAFGGLSNRPDTLVHKFPRKRYVKRTKGVAPSVGRGLARAAYRDRTALASSFS